MLTAFHPHATVFLSGIPPASRLAPVSALVSGAALAAVWSLRWPCVTLCPESRRTGSSRDVGVGSLPPVRGEGVRHSAWQIYLVSDTGNVILHLKNLWLLV